jgi:hypothetical protein
MNSKSENETKKESRMKMTTVVKSSVFAAALGLACLLPVAAHAQAEVSPDVYQVVSNETIVAEQQLMAASNTAKPADFQGRFALPYEVRCKGKSLKAGQYSVSVKSEGTTRVVTLAHNGQTMNIRAQELAGNRAADRSAMMVRKSPNGRMLEAVYVRQLNALLFLDVNAAAESGRMESLPIS